VIVLLDTNILIYLIKNHPPQVAERIDALDPGVSLAMSFITWAELMQGAEGRQRREATLRQLDQLARQVPVLTPEGPRSAALRPAGHGAAAPWRADRRKRPLDRLPCPGDRCHAGEPQRERIRPH
jgi:predicted nucleic acid-binding protein